MPARGVGVIELRGESLTPGYLTMGGFIPAQDEHGLVRHRRPRLS